MNCRSLNELISFLSEKDEKYNIYIWGVLSYGDLLGKLFYNRSIKWAGYYDNYVEEKELNEKKVFSGSDMKIDKNGLYILPIVNFFDVEKQLLENNIPDEQIIVFEGTQIFNELKKTLPDIEKYTAKISQIENIHNNEKCFIIGNGPSLSLEDLDALHLKNVPTFASNLIFKCYDKTDWRPSYYVFLDTAGIRKNIKTKSDLTYILDNCNAMLTRIDCPLYDYRDDNINNLYFFNSLISPTNDVFAFSNDCSEAVYHGYTVTYTMLQFAVYMGFKEIYLLGMDQSFTIEKESSGEIKKYKDRKNHSDILGNYENFSMPRPFKNNVAFESAKKYADEHGIKIYNATRGGKLEVFERKNFDDVMKEW